MRKYKKETLGWHNVYLDHGCEIAPKCLECPLPQCKHDDPSGYVRGLTQRRDARILEEMEQRGLSVDAAAQVFGVTVRTIFRVKARRMKEVQKLLAV